MPFAARLAGCLKGCMKRNRPIFEVVKRGEILRVGLLPVNDCAPLVIARELGYFAKYGLQVELKRLKSWTEIRDQMDRGDLDAAQAPASLPLMMRLGLGGEVSGYCAGMVTSLGGNAITISKELWEGGLRSRLQLARKSVHSRARLSFAVPGIGSTQHFLLRRWIQGTGLNPETDVRIVVVPPAQIYPTLKLGYIDGFCVSEPWNSVAVQAGLGICVATGSQLLPLHPETVVMTRNEFATERTDEHQRLIAALIEACEFCDRPWNRRSVASLISGAKYVDAPADCILPGIGGPFSTWDSRGNHPLGLNVFHRFRANDPDTAKLEWIAEQLVSCAPLGGSLTKQHVASLAREVYSARTYARAAKLVTLHARTPLHKAVSSAVQARSIAA
jgi:ABC-type nitrate/sulfonate/bicarbonate transport systems, periplasmic components